MKRRLPHRFLQFFLAGSFILAVIINYSPLVRGQIVKNEQDPETYGTVSADADLQPESPSLILVPNGMAAVTSTGADGPTLRVVDISQFGTLWAAAYFAPNYIDTPAQMPLMNSWLPSQFNDSNGNQSMRGLAISADGTKIYVGTSGYVGPNKTPNIYLIGPASTTPQLLATLPSYVTNPALRRGIAGLDLDEVHNAVFASSYADGIIYRVDATTGAVLGTFDPLNAFTGGTGLPPLGDRVIAVAYHRPYNRIFYTTWNGGIGLNSVRSIGLTAGGAFDPPTDRLEFKVAGSTAPVADIEFNNLGNRMLLAEEDIYEFAGLVAINAHAARGLEYYIGGAGVWSQDPTAYGTSSLKYNIGDFSGTNSRGGVAWGYGGMSGGGGVISGHESFVMFTGDALRYNSSVVYGLQYIPSTGGAGVVGGPSNSLIADLDYDVSSSDKMVYGDVDIRKTLSSASAGAALSGTVLFSGKKGVSKALVTLIGPDGQSRTAMTNPFGNYSFAGVGVGQTYVLIVSAKGSSFAAQVITVTSDMEVNFTALE